MDRTHRNWARLLSSNFGSTCLNQSGHQRDLQRERDRGTIMPPLL
jgi:hypothetical protein